MRFFKFAALAFVCGLCAVSFGQTPPHSARQMLFIKNLERRAKAAAAKDGLQIWFCIASADGSSSADVFGGDAKALLPLGQSSAPLTSLLACALEKEGLLKLSKPAAETASVYRRTADAKTQPRPAVELEKKRGATLENLLAMRAGLPPSLDAMAPEDSSAEDLFEFAAQTRLSAPEGDMYEYSLTSVSLGGYVCASAFDRKSKDLLKTYKLCLENALYKKLGIAGYGFEDKKIKTAFTPACGLLLDIKSVKIWIAAEVAGAPDVLKYDDVKMRRTSLGKDQKDRYGLGWTDARFGATPCQITSADAFKVSHIIAVFPYEGFAFAVFAKGKDEAAQKFCKDALEDAVQMAQSISQFEKKAP